MRTHACECECKFGVIVVVTPTKEAQMCFLIERLEIPKISLLL